MDARPHEKIAGLWILIRCINKLYLFPACPAYGETFVADTTDRCIYYWCVNGVFLQYQFRCAIGSGLPPSFSTGSHPCSALNPSCDGGGRCFVMKATCHIQGHSYMHAKHTWVHILNKKLTLPLKMHILGWIGQYHDSWCPGDTSNVIGCVVSWSE